MKTYTVRATRPDCDVCKFMKRPMRQTDAIVDAKTNDGPWANMCLGCWAIHGNLGVLGTGLGQTILVPLTALEEDAAMVTDEPCWGCGALMTHNESDHSLTRQHTDWCVYLCSGDLPEVSHV